jgi:hypothetical protein
MKQYLRVIKMRKWRGDLKGENGYPIKEIYSESLSVTIKFNVNVSLYP